MLFDSTLRRELARAFGATLVVVLTIVLTMVLIRTLGLAAGGKVSPQDVVLLLGFTALGYLPTILSLSLFVATVAALTRMYRDSEMTIWFASGVALSRFVRPVLRMAWPVLLVILLLALFVWPWVNQRGVELKDRYERRSDLSRVAAGQFQSSADGRRVFFIERDTDDARVGRNVFVLTLQGDTEAVTSARAGRIEFEGADRFILLERGQRNEQNLENGEKTLARFESYRALVDEKVPSGMVNLPATARSTLDLIRQPTRLFRAELTWRIGLVLGAGNLLLLAIGLAATNQRRPGNWNLLLALLAFVVYFNLINLSQAWVENGAADVGTVLLGVHGGMFLLALAQLWWRDHAQSSGVFRRRRRMKAVRRMLYAEIVKAVVFVALAFLSLFFFFDFIAELTHADDKGYLAAQAAIYSLLFLPGHLYELAPIAVLIGAIYALASMAQSSEFTILRTGGLGPGRALGALAGLGIAFAVFTFVLGDYIAPISETQAAAFKATFRGSLKLDRAGAWLKDRRMTPEGERSYSVNVGTASAGHLMRKVRIFEFDADGRLLKRIGADSAEVGKDAVWDLVNATVTDWNVSGGDGRTEVSSTTQPHLQWHSTLGADVVAAAVLPLTTMSTVDLFRYVRHLSENEQASQRHEIQFWKRALYPFACLVMLALALPFAYLHSRSGGVSLKVFGGIMLGISFVLLNNVAGHIGLLGNWTPWIVASAPSVFYLLLSMAAFSWLVRYR